MVYLDNYTIMIATRQLRNERQPVLTMGDAFEARRNAPIKQVPQQSEYQISTMKKHASYCNDLSIVYLAACTIYK